MSVIIIMEIEEDTSSSRSWRVLRRFIGKPEIVFLSQIIILYVVILTCIINLSINSGKNELWVSLLSYSLGCILPAPKVKKGQLNGQA